MAILRPRSLLNRRAFLGRSAAMSGAGLLSLTALGRLSARAAHAAAGGNLQEGGYGPLAAKAPDNNPGGFAILALPDGFSYVTFSAIGETLSDGAPVPVNLDGMQAYAHPTEAGVVRLIRNHEDRNAPGAGSVLGPGASKYDINGGGGTTTLDFDEQSPASPT